MTTSPRREVLGRTAAGALWALAARQSERLIGIANIAVLARVLTPADFGIVGMAGAAVSLVEILNAFGFDWALVRMAHPSKAHYDSAWTMRLLLGFTMAAVIAALSYPLTVFYGVPSIAVVLLAMAGNSLISSCENIGTVDFRRDMRFDREFRFRLTSKVLSFAASLAAAITLRSYWALIIGITVGRLVTVVSSYWMSAYRPCFDLSMRKDLLSFSGWLLLGNVMDTLRAKFADIFIGRTFGPRSVGFYAMALELSTLATSELAAPINRVAFSNYSQNAGNLPALTSNFQRVSGLIWIIGLPMAGGMYACADQIVLLLLGAQWGVSAAILKVLAISGAVAVMEANTHYVFWALGRARLVAALSAAGFIVFVPIAILAALSHGVVGVAYAHLIASVATFALNYAALTRTLRTRLSSMPVRNWRVLTATIAMVVVVHHFGVGLSDVSILSLTGRLVFMVLLGVSAYIFLLASLWILFGRSDGPERDSLTLVSQMYRSLRGHQ